MQSHVPFPTTPLLGRATEMADLRALLSTPRVRLITLTGAGGTGKSRLALELAAELDQAFARTWFVDLTAIGTPALVPSALAQAIGVQEGGSKNLDAIVKEMLSIGRFLVIFDNFEHLLPAAPYVATLLGACRDLVIVVTSREALALRSEHVYFVKPLAVPDLDNLDDLAALREVPSIALFDDRARASRADFQVTDDGLIAVAEICVRLDGLPLAIELAAAQSAVLPPRGILQRLSARAPLVGSRARDLPERHRTLEATVAWSYDLLTPAEQALFRQCGVFASGFSLAAIDAMQNGKREREDPLLTLAQLVAKSLVRTTHHGANAERFWLLDTIRTYALDRLVEHGELLVARQRHASYYVELAEHVQSALRGPGMAAALDALAVEYGNFRAVFQWCTEHADYELGLRLAGALYRFWIARGHLAEARAWLEHALPRSTAVRPQVRGIALHAAGVLAGMQQDHERARAYFTQSLALWAELGETARQAGAYLNLGLVAQDTGHLDDAQHLFQQAQELYSQVGGRGGMANAIGSRARVAREQGDLPRAMDLFSQCLALFRQIGDDWGIGNTLANLGQVMLALDDRAGALDAFRESLEVRRALGNILHIAESLEGVAAVTASSQPRLAVRLLGAAELMRETSGAPVPAVESGRFAELVERVRARLRDDTFRAGWNAGRALSVNAAIELALRNESPPAEEPPRDEAATMSEVLSPRELEIARLIGRGLSNRAISEALVVSIKTVETHVKHIFEKLKVRTRAGIAVWASRHNLL